MLINYDQVASLLGYKPNTLRGVILYLQGFPKENQECFNSQLYDKDEVIEWISNHDVKSEVIFARKEYLGKTQGCKTRYRKNKQSFNTIANDFMAGKYDTIEKQRGYFLIKNKAIRLPPKKGKVIRTEGVW